MTARSNIIFAATMACALAGCANDGSLSTGLNTGSVNPQTAATSATKSQEALCLTLASQIEALNTEGIPDKGPRPRRRNTSSSPPILRKAARAQQGQHGVPRQVLELSAARRCDGAGRAGDSDQGSFGQGGFCQGSHEDGSRQGQAAGAGAEVRGRSRGAAGDDTGLERAGGRGRAAVTSICELVLNFQAPAVS